MFPQFKDDPRRYYLTCTEYTFALEVLQLFRVLFNHALFESCHSIYLGRKIVTSCRALPKSVFF